MKEWKTRNLTASPSVSRLLFFTLSLVLLNTRGSPASEQVVVLPVWEKTEPFHGEEFLLAWSPPRVSSPFRKGDRVAYFQELLPAIFERTAVFSEFQVTEGHFEWIFTGTRGGFTVRVEPNRVHLFQRYYDSFGLNNLENGELRASTHPERLWLRSQVSYQGDLRAIQVALDHRLLLRVSLNGQRVLEQFCSMDVSRHQVSYVGEKVRVRGLLQTPVTQEATVRVYPSKTHQKILGFGGLTAPTAYARLSREGKERWWKWLTEYNLLIHREYPMGTRLARDMGNWDRLEDATPHYYGDNFPNGEVSDFEYLKQFRQMGGLVLFEFWDLPPWATRNWSDSNGKHHRAVADPEAYARAIVGYCQLSRERTGAPPDIIGIQNEQVQPPEIWREMVLTLRRRLDAAGFEMVQLQMPDAPWISKFDVGKIIPGASSGGADERYRLVSGIGRVPVLKGLDGVWKEIDFAAAHLYDYQDFLENPDGYDQFLVTWRQLIGEKPFLSTEIAINAARYQVPSYRLALSMGQLYHKNLVLANASAILYCWLLLDVEQPSYGWTRSLFVPDSARSFVPVPSSNQLRVYGAYSRSIHRGMVRVEVDTSSPDLLVTAFQGENGAKTLVILNRPLRAHRVTAQWNGTRFRFAELTDPYHENAELSALAPEEDGNTQLNVAPGSIVTLSTLAPGGMSK